LKLIFIFIYEKYLIDTINTKLKQYHAISQAERATLNDIGDRMDLLRENNEAHIKMQAAMLKFCCTRGCPGSDNVLTPVGPNQARGRNPLRPKYSSHPRLLSHCLPPRFQ